MIIIAGGVLLALVAFVVLRKLFVPVVLIVGWLWIWSDWMHLVLPHTH